MAIPNTPLTGPEFEYLADNIVAQVEAVGSGEGLAQSGLHYIVLLQVDAPEVDLVNPFNDQLQKMENINSYSNWVQVVAALNAHGATRGAVQTGTISDRLNAYFTSESICVSQTYADISLLTGYTIDGSHIVGVGC